MPRFVHTDNFLLEQEGGSKESLREFELCAGFLCAGFLLAGREGRRFNLCGARRLYVIGCAIECFSPVPQETGQTCAAELCLLGALSHVSIAIDDLQIRQAPEAEQ